MKVYISVDMEGISGVVLPDQVSGAGWEYQEARQLYIADANAAVDGAFDGGADEVIVADMHGRGFHFPLDQLHPRARYLMGGGHWPRFPFLDGCDALFLVGYHALHGTRAAVRDHTMSSAHWQDFWINDRLMGEVGIDAAYAGYLDIPVMLVTGDDKVCAEARALLGSIETAEVKQSVARHRALLLPPVRAQALIREHAKLATERVGQVPPLRIEGPVEIRLRYVSTDVAERRAPDGERIVREDGRTLLFRGQDVMEALRTVLA
jgi:D-amino peptidase